MTSLKVARVSRSWISDAIVEQLREQIIDGKLAEGDRLPPERELAVLFGVGRTSIREAIKALSAMGLVQRDKKGTYVTVPRPTDNNVAWHLLAKKASLRDLFETRRMLEVQVAQLAAERASEEDLEELEAALKLDEGPAGSDYELEAFARSDQAFHTALAAACENVVLYELYVAAQEMIFRSHRIYEVAYESGQVDLVRNALSVARGDHRAIFEAVAAQDPAKAGAAIKQHLTNMEAFVSRLT